jgi:hypothetical protein
MNALDDSLVDEKLKITPKVVIPSVDVIPNIVEI